MKTYECDVQEREQQQSKQEEPEDDDVCSTSNLRSSRGKRGENESRKNWSRNKERGMKETKV